MQLAEGEPGQRWPNARQVMERQLETWCGSSMICSTSPESVRTSWNYDAPACRLWMSSKMRWKRSARVIDAAGHALHDPASGHTGVSGCGPDPFVTGAEQLADE